MYSSDWKLFGNLYAPPDAFGFANFLRTRWRGTRAYVNAETAVVILSLILFQYMRDLVVKLSGWRNKVTKECEDGAFKTEHPPVHGETIAASHALGPASTFPAKRRSSRFSSGNLPADVPLWYRDPTYDTPSALATAHPPDRTIPFSLCVWYARLRHGCAHVRLIRLDMRALLLHRARLSRQRWITRNVVYARCCALLSFRHGVEK